MEYQEAKRAAGRKAAEFIENGQIVGLGTGSTAKYFIESLIERCRKGLNVTTVASSRSSAEIARKGGVEVVDINSVSHVDVTVDGADEIDPKKRMIKGGGGALAREKILASSSREMIVVVDVSKQVDILGKTPLPVEILFFGSPATRKKIENSGYAGKWRMNEDHTLFITENSNLIFDIHFEFPCINPEQVQENLIHIPGVVDTGFFFNLAGRVVVGMQDGSAKVIP